MGLPGVPHVLDVDPNAYTKGLFGRLCDDLASAARRGELIASGAGAGRLLLQLAACQCVPLRRPTGDGGIATPLKALTGKSPRGSPRLPWSTADLKAAQPRTLVHGGVSA